MKKFTKLAMLFYIVFYSLHITAQNKLSNPVVQIYDGCVERYMGYYYAMGTGTVGKIFQSKDMVNWTGPTLAATTDEATWLNDPQWTQAYTYKRVGAGDILYRNGVFHIYYNGIGHSYSDKPLGMYKEQCIYAPFDDYGIDAQVFQDEDGEIYYLKKVNPDDPHPINGGNYGKSGAKIWTFKMNSPFERQGIPGSEQMTHQIGHPTNIDWVNFEGPELFRYRDNYFLMYSPNRMSARTGYYEVGVAQSNEAMNFSNSKKYPHPVLARNMENHHVIYKQLLHTAEHGAWSAKYRTATPTGEWTAANYDDSGWTTGNGGFGLKNEDLTRICGNRTIWNTNQLFIRRKFTLEEVPQKMALKYRVEANTEFYINGNKLAINESKQAYSLIDVDPSWFKPGENIIAVKAENSCSGDNCFKFVDFGLFDTGTSDAEKIVIGQSQANCVVGPNGFERWIMYKAFFNGVSSQGIDRMHFYDKELVVESSVSANSPGYHPVPATSSFIDYFDLFIYYPYEFLHNSDWRINNGTLKPKEDIVSELLLRTEPMANYRFEVPFRIISGNGDEAGVYAYYENNENWVKVSVQRDPKKWKLEINENGSITTEIKDLPENFQFLEQHELVNAYDEPWHTLTVHKNGGAFKVELDYFNLTLNSPVITNFEGSGKVGLTATSTNVNFDAVQYTTGWDEWDSNISGWEFKTGSWQVSESGLRQTTPAGITLKGDKNYNYEFSVYMKNDQIPENGNAGFYPVYVDENNYVRAGINYATKKLEISNVVNGINTGTQSVSLNNKTSRQYTFDTYPTNSYRYDFRCETEVSGVDILWFEGAYSYLGQTFDLPESVKFYSLSESNTWVPLSSQLNGELRFSYLNSFTFDRVKTKAIRMEVTPKTGKAARAFSAFFNEEMASSHYLRCRRENDKLYIFVNDSLKTTLQGNWEKSNTGLFTESVTPYFNGMLQYQTGRVPVTKININDILCNVGESVALSATVEPRNATNTQLVWVSSNPAVASIDENNVLTRHTEGTVTITAWTADGGFLKGEKTVSGVNGLAKANLNNFKIYPNPADDYFIVQGEEPIEKIELYSLLGNKMLEQETGGLQMGRIEMTGIPSGLYGLKIYTANDNISTKIVKN